MPSGSFQLLEDTEVPEHEPAQKSLVSPPLQGMDIHTHDKLLGIFF